MTLTSQATTANGTPAKKPARTPAAAPCKNTRSNNKLSLAAETLNHLIVENHGNGQFPIYGNGYSSAHTRELMHGGFIDNGQEGLLYHTGKLVI